MELVLGRFDVANVGSNGKGCMKVLPSNKDAKKKQKLAIGDESGVMHCLQVKKGETSVVFETAPHANKKPCSALSLGTLNGDRDRIVAAFGNQIVCFQKKKGQILWQHQIEYGEEIRFLYCNERLVVYCTEFMIVAMIIDDKGEVIGPQVSYQCPDRIQDLLVLLPHQSLLSSSDSNAMYSSATAQTSRSLISQALIIVACRDRFVRFISVRYSLCCVGTVFSPDSFKHLL